MPAPKTPQACTTMEEKAEEILMHLRRIDARDKLRTWGGFVRGIISLVPLILLLWSSWYFYKHGAELMKMIANQAASSAAEYTKNQSSGMLDQFMNQYSNPNK
jgi:hypothetical protein